MPRREILYVARTRRALRLWVILSCRLHHNANVSLGELLSKHFHKAAMHTRRILSKCFHVDIALPRGTLLQFTINLHTLHNRLLLRGRVHGK
jgi:hypothetical protein